MVDLQLAAVGQQVGAADFFDQGLGDDLGGQAVEEGLVDGALDLLPGQPPGGLEAEHPGGGAAGFGLLPDADGGPHADVALPHGKLFHQGQPGGPALHKPFAFDLHGSKTSLVFYFLVSAAPSLIYTLVDGKAKSSPSARTMSIRSRFKSLRIR